jgi:antitoxin component YwqK of YwqJK toxin-antitoxin module
MKGSEFKYFVIAVCSLFLASCSGDFDGKNGVKTIKFPDVDKVCQLIEYKDGRKNGTLKEFFKNGNLKTIQHFKDDKNVDSAIYYHPNGQLSAIQIHKDGKKTGCWQKFNEQGKCYSKISFEDDLLNGPSQTFSYKSLRLIENYNFKYGLKHGKQETFYNSGKPKSIAYYYDDQPGLGTEEYSENSERLNDDFAVKVTESNKVNLENRLYFYVTLANPQPEDEVWRVLEKDTGSVVTRYQRLEKKGDAFVLEFGVYAGGFVMEKVKIAAYRKTASGNILIKTTAFNASANHY